MAAADKFWFVMYTGTSSVKEDAISCRVYTGIRDGRPAIYFLKAPSEQKNWFPAVEDCKRLLSLCDMYLTADNDKTTMISILERCTNVHIKSILAGRIEKTRLDNVDPELKAREARKFIIEKVDNVNISDILIDKFAPLMDIDEIKAKKLRSMQAAMRALI